MPLLKGNAVTKLQTSVRIAIVIVGVTWAIAVLLVPIPEGIPTESAPTFFAAAMAVNASLLIAVSVSASGLLRRGTLPDIFPEGFIAYVIILWLSLLVSVQGLLASPSNVNFFHMFFIRFGWLAGVIVLVLSIAYAIPPEEEN